MAIMIKSDWHWKCRWFNHRYYTSGGFTSERVYHWDTCVRCGFDPRNPGGTL